ncbi:MAG: hypothetical protein AB7Q37_03415 [Pyrinomonadaceae bacterium]
MPRKTNNKKIKEETKSTAAVDATIEQIAANEASTQSFATEAGRYNEPLWTDRLDACLTDEFRYQLNEVLNKTAWQDVRHGQWADSLAFFEYFDFQVKFINRWSQSPTRLENHLNSLNPTRTEIYNTGGTAEYFARLHLPLARQQVFILNALRLVLENRERAGPELRRAGKIVSSLLHRKIGEMYRFLANLTGQTEWDDLANRVDARRTVSDKANEAIRFLGEILSTVGLRKPGDWRETLLFMRKRRESPPKFSADNVLVSQNAFNGDTVLERYCDSLFHECNRLLALVSLEGLEHGAEESIKEAMIDNEEMNEQEEEARTDGAKHIVERNAEQVFLALEFILRQLRATGSNKAKAKVMSFLSGYSAETMRRGFSENSEWENRRQNLVYVRSMFENAGMTSMRKILDGEIAELNK